MLPIAEIIQGVSKTPGETTGFSHTKIRKKFVSIYIANTKFRARATHVSPTSFLEILYCGDT
jgi:hypothetical protein